MARKQRKQAAFARPEIFLSLALAMARQGKAVALRELAIEAAVPGKVVLDIGTGSGLLAMMAARAGAARVIACEMNAAVAETARRIIAANGLADRMRCMPAIPAHLNGPACSRAVQKWWSRKSSRPKC